MATIVVEPLVSEAAKLLLGKIGSGEFVKFFRSTKLNNDLLENLNITLLSLQAVLIDAEQKQITNSAVKEWLVKLQDAVFEVEDLFDEINTEALCCRLKAEKKGKRAKVWKFISSHFKSSYKTINSKMDEVLIKLKNFEKQVQNLGLVVGVSSIVWHGTPTTSVAVDESSIYGRVNDKNKLKGFLLSDNAREGDGKIGVVSIVGMGGLGKTTIAKQLFNDPEVKQKFTLKGWAHISKDFDVLNLTKALLDSITGESIEGNNLNTLQVQLQKSLNGKMFLLVLDDIWDVRYDVWNSLMDIFNVGETGSRIIITTRNESDAITMRNFLPIYKLQPLESDDCWSLLAKHAFGASNNQQRSDLEKIGREIAQKCDGLPLAAVALGGLLRTKLSLDSWNHVLKSNIWKLQNTGVQPALLLSYHYLPSHLKRCFAYCAIFPKNYKLEKEMIVLLWIAEGLVLHPESEKSWETEAEEYFDELVLRSLIQQRSNDGETIFEMHDLMNDLAITVSSPYCARLDEQKLVESFERVRHLSYNRNGSNSYNKFDRLHGLKGLRTFLSLPLQDWWLSDDCISDKEVGDLFLKMKHLHSLSLSNCSLMTKVPTSIGNLMYLRYLNLSNTPIERLPSETCKLVNLQTLLVSNCESLIELPVDMGKLMSLRNLDVSGTPLREIPVQITKLKNLLSLSNFIVSNQCDGLKVGDLGKFPHLRGNLFISELQNVTDHSDASQANLEMKKQIDILILDWRHSSPSDSDSQIQSGVLERLQPSTNLMSLTLKGYGGTKFPNWLGDASFGKMVCLEIKNCHICLLLPPLGQLGNLKQLIIKGMKSLKSVGDEFYRNESGPSLQPFPSLETLSFEDMQEWEEWNLSTTVEFPVLRCLTLKGCPKLKGNIPTNLPFLTKLELVGCPLLVEPWSSDDNSNMLSLESLRIEKSCYSMTSFTLGTFPILKSLDISSCENLKSVVIVSQQESLSSLSICFCHEVESISFGGIGLGLSIPNLNDLTVWSCKKLHSLLEPMKTLVGLRSMDIHNLPNLQSIGKDGFPINLRQLVIGSGDIVDALMKMKVGLLPTSLETLWISNIGDIEHLDGKWIQHLTSLQLLTCLTFLTIGSGDIVEAVMKMKVGLLPTSLKTLQIWYLGDIEHLDGKWLQHLTSLQLLEIWNAPNLKSLPDEGFPASLSELSIYKCPLLEERWKDKKGKEWTKIAHIPTININLIPIKDE